MLGDAEECSELSVISWPFRESARARVRIGLPEPVRAGWESRCCLGGRGVCGRRGRADSSRFSFSRSGCVLRLEVEEEGVDKDILALIALELRLVATP